MGDPDGKRPGSSRHRAQVQDAKHRRDERADQADTDQPERTVDQIGRPSTRVQVRMSKISDETKAPMGSGTTNGWNGWPSGPADADGFIPKWYHSSLRAEPKERSRNDLPVRAPTDDTSDQANHIGFAAR